MAVAELRRVESPVVVEGVDAMDGGAGAPDRWWVAARANEAAIPSAFEGANYTGVVPRVLPAIVLTPGPLAQLAELRTFNP